MFINSQTILFHLSLQLLSPPISIILKPVPDFVISSINVLVHVCISEREDLTFFEIESFSHPQTNDSNNCSLMSLVSQSSSFQSSHKFDSVSSLLLFVFSAWPHWPPGYFLAFLMIFCFGAFAQTVHTAWWAPLPHPGGHMVLILTGHCLNITATAGKRGKVADSWGHHSCSKSLSSSHRKQLCLSFNCSFWQLSPNP